MHNGGSTALSQAFPIGIALRVVDARWICAPCTGLLCVSKLHVRVWYVSTSISVLSGFAHHRSMESLSGSRVHEKPRCRPNQASRPLRDFLQFPAWICHRPLCVRFLRQLLPFQRCQWATQLRIREICYLYCFK